MELTDATVYCLVRAEDEKAGIERIKNNAQYFKCWKDNYKERLVPIIGYLEKPLMGISSETFEKLSNTIDTIYHNGAVLNFIYPYDLLNKTNVIGTKECLRLACLNKPKYFHYVSSYSVFDNPSHFKSTAYEDDKLDKCEGYFLGYSESKWVAEKIVRIAESRGLKICIYRPGEITGSSETGIWKMNDLVVRSLISMIQLKIAPNSPIKLHLTPVDFVSKAIVKLSMKKEFFGKAFNLVNPSLKTIPEIASFIKEYGYNIDFISFEDWRQELLKSGEEIALKVLEELFFRGDKEEETMKRRYADVEAIFDTKNAKEGLNDTGVVCPCIDDSLLTTYFDYFVKAGYVDKPIKAKTMTCNRR